MKNSSRPALILAALVPAVLFSATPAHAKGLGLISDLWTLGQNVFNGTIPRPYVLGFAALIGTILFLGVIEARKNARKAAREAAETPPAIPIDLTK